MTNDEQNLLNALVRDIVDLAISSKRVIASGSFKKEDMGEVLLLSEMSDEILNRFTKKVENEK